MSNAHICNFGKLVEQNTAGVDAQMKYVGLCGSIRSESNKLGCGQELPQLKEDFPDDGMCGGACQGRKAAAAVRV